MTREEAKEPIKIYLDDQVEPFKTDYPPLRFSFSTIHLADGAHRLRVEASNGLAPPTTREIPFNVRNGVAVTVSGLEPNQTIGGQVELIINAYAGNTEVDFEPRRAETPQPIPTWSWVLLLGVIAWTMFYVFNPAKPPRDAGATTFELDRSLGERLYMDTCARCHDEDGSGRRDPDEPANYVVKKLRDTPNLAVAETPYRLLFKVVTGVRSTGMVEKPVRMPAWGPRLTNEEIVAVVNYVRSSWGHDASLINPRYRRPPKGITELEDELLQALQEKDEGALEACCWPEGPRRLPPPQLYRIDGPRWANDRDEVATEWKGYFEALGSSTISQFSLTDVRYDYEPETVEQAGSRVFAMGRIFLETKGPGGGVESEQGRFIRVYHRVRDAADTGAGREWALIFDFASIPMRVGCDPDAEEICPPDGPVPPAVTAAGIGYAEIQAFFAGLKRDPGDAPHERFWTLPYEEFVALEFPVSWDQVDDIVPLLVVGNSKDSNIVRALRDGKRIQVRAASGNVVSKDIERMPKGGLMPPEDVDKIAAWIDAGCPEFALDTPPSPPPREPDDTEPPVRQPVVGGPVGPSPIGYADVQRIFRNVNRDPGDSPHERFWDLPYEEFVQLEFPYSWDDPEVTVKLLEVWNSAESNMIRALQSGQGLRVQEGGRSLRRNIAQMPKGAKPILAQDLANLAAWIDAGCPREAGGESPWPRPGAAAAPPAPPAVPEGPGEPETAPDVPPSLPPTAPVVATGFAEVRAIFKALGQKAPSAPHSNFWRELDYREFVSFEFPEGPGLPGMVRLLVPWDSAASNVLRALKDGKGIAIRHPDGRVVVRDIPPMPKDADPMPEADLERLRAWIDAGCPEFAGQPSALPRPK